MSKEFYTMDKIVALCKNRGFLFPGSEIYGGLANSWDYGNLGVELKVTGYVRNKNGTISAKERKMLIIPHFSVPHPWEFV